MSVRGRLWICTAACSFAAVLLFISGITAIQKGPSPIAAVHHPVQAPVQVEDVSLAAPASEPALHFIVKSYQGQICIFQSGQSLPVQNTGIWVSTLPDKDQALLENGIPVASQKDLAALLEDYGY